MGNSERFFTPVRTTRGLSLLVVAVVVVAYGCSLPRRRVASQMPPQRPEPPFSHYHATGFDWSMVNRVLVVPVVNETAFPRVGDEVKEALVAEMQQLGRFEVVPAPPDAPDCLGLQVRDGGCFDERLVVALARMHRADVIIAGTVTHCGPYAPQQLGVVFQAISPAGAVVVASIDGLWDSSKPPVANAARAFGAASSDPGAVERVFESPRLYQRFVCCQVAKVLTNPPTVAPKPGANFQPATPGVSGGPNSTDVLTRLPKGGITPHPPVLEDRGPPARRHP